MDGREQPDALRKRFDDLGVGPFLRLDGGFVLLPVSLGWDCRAASFWGRGSRAAGVGLWFVITTRGTCRHQADE